ncbi:LysR family transcriptional regulator substrate-binding protein [Sphingobium chungangianum]
MGHFSMEIYALPGSHLTGNQHLHMTSVLASFLKEHPAIDVTAIELSNSAIIAGVTDGTLDLGVAFGPIEAPLPTQPLYNDRLMLACASGHSLASLDRVPLEALAKESLALLTPDYSTRRALDRYFEEHGIVPLRIIELNTFASILNLVEAGLCLSVMPGPPDENASKRGGVIFRPLAPAPPLRSIQLLLPPVAARSPAAIVFASNLRARFD